MPSYKPWQQYLMEAVLDPVTYCLIHPNYGAGQPRRVYERYYGRKRTGFVCHTCDNPVCINIGHMWEGTHTDNQRDSVSKGRHTSQLNQHWMTEAKRSPDVRKRMSESAKKRGYDPEQLAAAREVLYKKRGY